VKNKKMPKDRASNKGIKGHLKEDGDIEPFGKIFVRV